MPVRPLLLAILLCSVFSSALAQDDSVPTNAFTECTDDDIPLLSDMMVASAGDEFDFGAIFGSLMQLSFPCQAALGMNAMGFDLQGLMEGCEEPELDALVPLMMQNTTPDFEDLLESMSLSCLTTILEVGSSLEAAEAEFATAEDGTPDAVVFQPLAMSAEEFADLLDKCSAEDLERLTALQAQQGDPQAFIDIRDTLSYGCVMVIENAAADDVIEIDSRDDGTVGLIEALVPDIVVTPVGAPSLDSQLMLDLLDACEDSDIANLLTSPPELDEAAVFGLLGRLSDGCLSVFVDAAMDWTGDGDGAEVPEDFISSLLALAREKQCLTTDVIMLQLLDTAFASDVNMDLTVAFRGFERLSPECRGSIMDVAEELIGA